MPKLNLKNIARPEPVPEATYACNVTGHRNDKVKTGDYKDTDRINLELTINDGDFAGRKLFKSYILDDDLLWIFKQDMLVLEADPKMLENEEADTDLVVKSTYGNTCAAEVSINSYVQNGEDRTNNRVERIHEPSWS